MRDKRVVIWMSVIWALSFLAVFAVIHLYNRDPRPMAIDATPAASTHCVKPPQPCGANCVRLISNRSLV